MSKKTMILVIGALVALVGIVGAAILIYMLIKNTGQPTAVSTPSTTVTQPETPKTTETTSPSTTEQPAVNPTPTPQPSSETTTTPPADRDNDGLSDEEEATLGTNPDLPDTDNDGLTDREEVKVYKTDPRNADTDGDGYLDGQEVKGGYNPNGPGKMNVTQ